MRIKEMSIHSNLSKIKKPKILPICSQGKYRDSLGEFSNTSYGGREISSFFKTIQYIPGNVMFKNSFCRPHKRRMPKNCQSYYYTWETIYI